MKKIHLIIFIFIGFILTSCEEVIEVDVPANTEKIMIEGAVTSEVDSSFIRITKSVAYFDNTKLTPFVTNAGVTVNGFTFFHIGNGMYKPSSPFAGIPGQKYNMRVLLDGKEYSSSSFMEPMFDVDTVVTYYKEAEGFIEAGYAVKYIAIDNRKPVKYTYFRFGFKNEIDTKGNDSLNDFRVLFDNKNNILNETFEFELPFLRLQPNDTALLIFRSIDEPTNLYYQALNNRGNGGGPFSTPPANLPSNIIGENALGLFAAYDVKRFRTKIVE